MKIHSSPGFGLAKILYPSNVVKSAERGLKFVIVLQAERADFNEAGDKQLKDIKIPDAARQAIEERLSIWLHPLPKKQRKTD